MRVVHVAPTPFGSDGLYGGGERYPLELARALARRGDIDCELVTFGPRSARYEDESGLAVRVLRATAHLRHHPAHPIGPGLVSAVSGADVVHTHHVHSTPSRVAAVAAKAAVRHQARVVSTDHGLAGRDWHGLLLRLFDRFLTVSEYSAATLDVPPDRTRVVYGGADPDRFHPDPAGPRDGVLFVGRITPHKGLDRLVSALPEGAALTVLGTAGHDRAAPERAYPALVRRLAAGRPVRFAGPASEAALADGYRRAALFVLPSVEETCYGTRVQISELLGLSLLEAMASATPVVASRVGGVPEVVVDGETGFLVEPGDVTALRDRIATVLGDHALARRLGDNGRALVVERFTWEACAERCVAAYQELVR
jgi:glycosyltransferase involved in cell wall biosynthesis